MIRIANEQDLLATFRDQERESVQTPPGFQFPLAIKDYLAWPEPSGHRVYLVFGDPATGHPLGVVFQRGPTPADGPASMCQWCHTVRTGGGVTLLTTAAGRNRRVGVHLCSDLSCRDRALGMPGRHDFNEGLSAQEKMQRLLRRMGEFAHGQLF